MSRVYVYFALYDWGVDTIGTRLAAEAGADLCKLDPVMKFRQSREAVGQCLMREVGCKYEPKLEPLPFDPTTYDEIILGSQVFYGSMAPALRTFLAKNGHKLSGKTIRIVTVNDAEDCTLYKKHAIEQITELLPDDCTIAEGLDLSLPDIGDTTHPRTEISTPELDAWIASL